MPLGTLGPRQVALSAGKSGAGRGREGALLGESGILACRPDCPGLVRLQEGSFLSLGLSPLYVSGLGRLRALLELVESKEHKAGC